MSKIGVLGAGTWGMALARSLSNAGHDVTVWSALPEEIEEYSRTRIHKNLPGMIIPDAIKFTKDIAEACRGSDSSGKDIILFAVPSVYVRSTAEKARSYIPDGQIIVDVAKGIEPETLLTLTEVIGDELKRDGLHEGVRFVALSGPTHAEEVSLDQPTLIVSACANLNTARIVQDIFMTPFLRVYVNDDIKGVELCGAMKNIVALASGITAGLGYGDNARAALITRGMAEIARLGMKMGCKERTFPGLAGIGDLIVTATSMHSRNNKAGFLIGKGLTPDEAKEKIGMVVEGINALPAAMELQRKYDVEMPIANAVNSVITDGESPLRVAGLLMLRGKKHEWRKVPSA